MNVNPPQSPMAYPPSTPASLKDRVHEIIFEAETYWGKAFDVALLAFIGASVLAVALETVEPWASLHRPLFLWIEWSFTVIFTLEYLLRLWCVRHPLRYATSFFGVIDLLSILPTFLSLFFVGTHYLLVIRALRLLRVFRIFKLAHFLNEGHSIIHALRASRAKISVFLLFVSLLVIILGSVMYLIEGNANSGFTNIPRSIYWAIVTLTTVGYGDIAPATALGQTVAALIMMLGYAIIAVPTGIVTAELTTAKTSQQISTIACPSCSREGHDGDAKHCKYCGHTL